jgi:hypothetical protein
LLSCSTIERRHARLGRVVVESTRRIAVTTPAAGQPVSFAQEIKPLFRESDRESMDFAFDLWDADDVRSNADAILERLRDGTMPCDGGWSSEKVELFARWIATGTAD